LSRAEGRRFGLTVGGAFLLLAALSWWRGGGRSGVAVVLAGVAGLLLLGALLVPASLGPVERAWMGLARVLSKVTTPVFMGVVYLGVIMPVGLVLRTMGRNPLRRRGSAGSFWVARDRADQGREHMEHLF
jgi:hypothetical protein